MEHSAYWNDYLFSLLWLIGSVSLNASNLLKSWKFILVQFVIIEVVQILHFVFRCLIYLSWIWQLFLHLSIYIFLNLQLKLAIYISWRKYLFFLPIFPLEVDFSGRMAASTRVASHNCAPQYTSPRPYLFWPHGSPCGIRLVAKQWDYATIKTGQLFHILPLR